jgi:hypothetical protein
MNSWADKEEANRVRIGLALEYRPFTCAFGFLVAMSVVASVVYLGVFSDTDEEIRRHFAQCAIAFGTTGLLFLFFFWQESHGPFPLRLRRLFWHAAVWGYAVIGAAIFALIALPYTPSTPGIRLLCNWAVVSPIPFTAWGLLKKTQPARPSRRRYP